MARWYQPGAGRKKGKLLELANELGLWQHLASDRAVMPWPLVCQSRGRWPSEDFIVLPRPGRNKTIPCLKSRSAETLALLARTSNPPVLSNFLRESSPFGPFPDGRFDG
jgi:hypothetical protein